MGLPWFEFYADDKKAIDGAQKLGKIKSVKDITPKSGTNFWTDDLKLKNPKVIQLGRRPVPGWQLVNPNEIQIF